MRHATLAFAALTATLAPRADAISLVDPGHVGRYSCACDHTACAPDYPTASFELTAEPLPLLTITAAGSTHTGVPVRIEEAGESHLRYRLSEGGSAYFDATTGEPDFGLRALWTCRKEP